MSGLLPPPEPAPARKAVPGVVRLPLRSGVFLVSARSLSESGGFVVTWHVAAVRGCGCQWRAARRTMIEGRHGHREPGRARPSRWARHGPAPLVVAVKRDLIEVLQKMRRAGRTDVSDLKVSVNATGLGAPLRRGVSTGGCRGGLLPR